MSDKNEELKSLGCDDWTELDQKVLETYRSRSRELSECTLTFIDTIRALRERGQADVECLWNAACHVNLVYHDVLGLLFYMSKAGDGWATRILARALATLIYEAVEDLNHLFGKQYYDACGKADVPDTHVDALNAGKKELSAFGKKYETLVKRIRMSSGAHRDHDVIAFIISIGEAAPDPLLDIATEFREVLCRLGEKCQQIIEAANDTYRKRGVIP